LRESERELRETLRTARLRAGEAQILRIADFLDYVLRFNERFNLVSRKAGGRDLAAHAADSVSLARLLERLGITSVCDVGSGAGFPGIVLKILLPSLGVKLVEIREKKALFLENAASFLGIKGIEVINRDINRVVEDGARFRCVVSKAFRPLEEWLMLGGAAVEPGGFVIAMAGKNQRLPDDDSLSRSGLEIVEIDDVMYEFTGNRNLLFRKKIWRLLKNL